MIAIVSRIIIVSYLVLLATLLVPAYVMIILASFIKERISARDEG
jgi:hypothetical protein